MEDYDENKEPAYLKYWNVNNLYGRSMSQNLAVNDFKCVEDISEFNQDFIKSYNDEKRMKNVFLKMMFNMLKIYKTFIVIYHFCLKE